MAKTAHLALVFAAITTVVAPLAAKDSLGVFSGWAAFRDSEVPRCYAIAKPEPSDSENTTSPYASFGTWPESDIRNQLHIRLSQPTARNARITLRVGNRNFVLTGSEGNAWSRDAAMDAAVIAAIRAADQMTVRSIAENGRRFADRYALAGAATAIDAATLACSRRAR